MQDSCKNIDMDSVYQEYASLVYRFIYSYTQDVEWSQELMQETFLRAVGSISRYNGSCKLSVWLCQIAKHVLYQELRKKKRAEMVELADYLSDDSSPNGESSVLNQENKIELYQAIHHLPELEREVILYRITGKLSFREIEAILEMSENWSRTVFIEQNRRSKRSMRLLYPRSDT